MTPKRINNLLRKKFNIKKKTFNPCESWDDAYLIRDEINKLLNKWCREDIFEKGIGVTNSLRSTLTGAGFTLALDNPRSPRVIAEAAVEVLTFKCSAKFKEHYKLQH